MSERTLESRCWRSRASDIEERNRRSSTRCSERSSRWRERLFCLSVEEVRADSESRRRESWAMSDSRWIQQLTYVKHIFSADKLTLSSRSCICASVLCSSSDGFWGRLGVDAN